MTAISATEEPYEERLPVALLAYFFDQSVAANDTVEVNTKGYSSFLVYLKVSGACNITLDAVSPVGADYDSEYSITSFITINETVKTFSGAGSDIIDLNEVISTKKALKANFLRFKFSATVTASFAIIGKSEEVSKSLKNYVTGTTTDSYVDALDWACEGWQRKTIILKNTDGANSLDYKVLVYAYPSGNSYEEVSETLLSAGSTAKIVLNDTYAEVKVQVKAASAGNQATYRLDYVANR